MGAPGRIDSQYPPNVSMIHAAFDIPEFFGPYAEADPEQQVSPVKLDPPKATEIVKNYALHLGADAVGICKVNPN